MRAVGPIGATSGVERIEPPRRESLFEERRGLGLRIWEAGDGGET